MHPSDVLLALPWQLRSSKRHVLWFHSACLSSPPGRTSAESISGSHSILVGSHRCRRHLLLQPSHRCGGAAKFVRCLPDDKHNCLDKAFNLSGNPSGNLHRSRKSGLEIDIMPNTTFRLRRNQKYSINSSCSPKHTVVHKLSSIERRPDDMVTNSPPFKGFMQHAKNTRLLPRFNLTIKIITHAAPAACKQVEYHRHRRYRYHRMVSRSLPRSATPFGLH